MEIVDATVGDRSWAELFATLAFGDEPCELIVESGPHVHRVAFAYQAVVAASSPLASDSALGIALTHDVITPAMVPEVALRIARAPTEDPVDALAAVARLPSETTLLVRRRVIAVAASRVFALGHGTYRVTRAQALPIHAGAAIDVRALIYEGIRTQLTDEQLGALAPPRADRFALHGDAHADLPQFGFGSAESPVLDALRSGASLADLEADHPELGARGVRAIVVALLAGRAIVAAPRSAPLWPRPRTTGELPAQTLARASSQLPVARMRTTGELTAAPAPPLALELAEEPRTRRSGSTTTYELAEQPRSRISERFAAAEPALELAEPAAPAAPPPTGSWAVPVRGVGRPTLGAPRPAPSTSAPRSVTPVPRARPVTDPNTPISGEFSVSIRPSRPTLQGAAVAPPLPASPPPELTASQHYDRGVALLEHDLPRAIADLQIAALSGDVDHQATLAWAVFCAALDKEAVARATKAALAKAVYHSTNPSLAHFYLGRMERMLGRDRESLSHFKAVVALNPRHPGALAEVRTLEARLFPTRR